MQLKIDGRTTSRELRSQHRVETLLEVIDVRLMDCDTAKEIRRTPCVSPGLIEIEQIHNECGRVPRSSTAMQS
jgi:hypothetical protein